VCVCVCVEKTVVGRLKVSPLAGRRQDNKDALEDETLLNVLKATALLFNLNSPPYARACVITGT